MAIGERDGRGGHVRQDSCYMEEDHRVGGRPRHTEKGDVNVPDAMNDQMELS